METQGETALGTIRGRGTFTMPKIDNDLSALAANGPRKKTDSNRNVTNRIIFYNFKESGFYFVKYNSMHLKLTTKVTAFLLKN